MNRSFELLLLCFAHCVVACAPVSAITIDTVVISNPGNANDPLNSNRFGAVAYEYRIGKYEVTVGQYTAFLNAVAKTDTYNLYNPDMGQFYQTTGISRAGSPGSYQYNIVGSPQHPAFFVSWADAIRFTNWLHNGQPVGMQDSSTTEDGAYAINGALTTASLGLVSRNAAAKWFLPTESEWYKAAYFQPRAQGGDTDNYWRYPTRTNAFPNSDQPPGAESIKTNVANFFRNDNLANGFNDGFAVTGSVQEDLLIDHLTDVGAYTFASSFSGTFDQAGNVAEWTETLGGSNNSRRVRGGGYLDSEFGVNSSGVIAIFPTSENTDYGFRVAAIPSVPEPSTLALTALGALGLLICARRRF